MEAMGLRKRVSSIAGAAFLLCACGCAVLPVSASAEAGALILEPAAGASPYLEVIAGARKLVEVNAYLLTDTRVVQALLAAARRGVEVRVIVAGNPEGDRSAVAEERQAFRDSRVQFRLAPPQFERGYVYDHAKYLVADPGLATAAAILGSSNLSYSGLGGADRDYDYRTQDPTVVAELARIFTADWEGVAYEPPQGTLVVSPGSQDALVGLIDSAKGRLWIESEELGSDRAVLAAIERQARAHVQVLIVLPQDLSATDLANARAVASAGARVVLLSRPEVHAKLIVADARAFIGSENLTSASLERNREVGIILSGPPTASLAETFQQDFAAGRDLQP